jgi:peptide-methionine (S)-S-oxide reductase
MQTAILGNGCFWCTEAVFQQLKGVQLIESGYSGGNIENPTYEQICTGSTNHAECIRISFDENIVSYETILQVFFATHNPTTLNQQGNDIGTQYRSIIFYTTDAQKQVAESYISQLEAIKTFSSSIVTFIQPAVTFYVAENYHQNYYNTHKAQSYCQFVVRPKVEKFNQLFANVKAN